MVLAPPGKRRVLFKFLKKESDLPVYDIDSKICESLGAETIRQAITTNTRNVLEDEWKKAVHHFLEQIESSKSSPEPSILVIHTLYYNDSTREFFTIFDTSFLLQLLRDKKLTLSHVILAIDDIFDTLFILSGDKELYGHSALYDFMNEYSKALEVPIAYVQNNPTAHLSWLHYCLNSILNWRSQEVILAQNIAKQGQSRFILWGIKQNPQVLIAWLKSERKIFYVSHPISDPRRFRASNPDWPEIVCTINNVQETFRANNMLTVMPTAIDEYRFEKSKDNKGNYTSRLTPRWPVPQDTAVILTENELMDKDIDKTNIIFPELIEFDMDGIKNRKEVQIAEIQGFVNGVWSTLEMSVREQLGNRDHLLVWSTDGIIVIHPYTPRKDGKRGAIHGGVQKELDYLRKVNATLASPRQLCAIFLKDTVRSILAEEDFKEEYIDQLCSIVSQKHGQRLTDVSQSIDENGDFRPVSGAMGTQYIPRAVRDQISPRMTQYKYEAIEAEFISRTLTMDIDSLKFISIIFLNEIKDLTSSDTVRKIRDFLVGGVPDDSWKQDLHASARGLVET